MHVYQFIHENQNSSSVSITDFSVKKHVEIRMILKKN